MLHTIMVIADYISVFIMLFSILIIAKQKESRMQKIALLVCCSLFLACLGFLIREEASAAEVMIVGQKLMYAAVPHGMFLMILFIFQYCGFKVPNIIQAIFHGINTVLSCLILTLDHHKMFYKSYWSVQLDENTWILEKEYGFLHTVTLVLFGIYIVTAAVTAFIFTIRNVHVRQKGIWKILLGSLLPCIAYVASKLTDIETDYMPIAFSIFALIIINSVYTDRLYDVKNIAYNLISESMNEGLIVFDRNYTYKGCNEMAASLFPELKTTELDSDIRNISPKLAEYLDGNKDDYIFGDKSFGVSLRTIEDGSRKIGRVLWFNDETLDRYYTASLNDQKRRLESEVEALSEVSYKDALTNIGNRLAYKEYIVKIKESQNYEHLTVISIDLNGLKVVNDTYGHSAGDEIIKGAADVISTVFGSCSKCFRTGGDEFAVIINTPDIDVPMLLEKLLSRMHSWRGHSVEKLSLSFGYASGADNPDISIDEIIAIADKTMYEAKRDYYQRHGIKQR